MMNATNPYFEKFQTKQDVMNVSIAGMNPDNFGKPEVHKVLDLLAKYNLQDKASVIKIDDYLCCLVATPNLNWKEFDDDSEDEGNDDLKNVDFVMELNLDSQTNGNFDEKIFPPMFVWELLKLLEKIADPNGKFYNATTGEFFIWDICRKNYIIFNADPGDNPPAESDFLDLINL